jgi:hypothetical protein
MGQLVDEQFCMRAAAVCTRVQEEKTSNDRFLHLVSTGQPGPIKYGY